MSRIVVPVQKYITFKLWPTTSGVNPNDPCFLPVQDLLWVERNSNIKITIYYGQGWKVEITHTTDSEQRVYQGFKDAFTKAMIGGDANTGVSFLGQPLEFFARTHSGANVSTKKPPLSLKSVTIIKA